MKILSPVSLLICVLAVANAGISGIPNANAQQPAATAVNAPSQEASQDNKASTSLSGNWQISWAGRNGQRQGTLQIKQDGSKLSGTFEGERGSVPLKGRLEGTQVSFNVKARKRQMSFTGTVDGGKMSGTTEQGSSWTATRQ